MLVRGAPCGSTWYVAQELEGFPLEDAELESGNKIHNYPCIASMATDSIIGDTILHLAGYKIKEAVKEGLDLHPNQLLLMRKSVWVVWTVNIYVLMCVPMSRLGMIQ